MKFSFSNRLPIWPRIAKPVQVASLPFLRLLLLLLLITMAVLLLHDNCSCIRTLIREISVFDFLLAISCPFFEKLVSSPWRGTSLLHQRQRTSVSGDNDGLVSPPQPIVQRRPGFPCPQKRLQLHNEDSYLNSVMVCRLVVQKRRIPFSGSISQYGSVHCHHHR